MGVYTPTVVTTNPTKLLKELHATALAIIAARERNDAAGGRVMLEHFRQIAAAYVGTGAGDLTHLDGFILSTGKWIAGSAAAAAQMLRDAAALITDVNKKLAEPITDNIWPLVIGGVVVALILFSPELKTAARAQGAARGARGRFQPKGAGG